jgi:alpha-L-rhamnosidase
VSQPTSLYHLTAERLTNPIGIDATHPRLGWKLATDRVGAAQTAYRILVDGGNLWDSGWVESSDSVDVRYAGPELSSRQQVTWTVSIRDETGVETTSVEATWEMGLLNATDWQAEWIGSPLAGGPRTSFPPAYLRKGFSISQSIERARLYITALGVYEASINGVRVGDQELAPGWTDYAHRVRYQVFDVGHLLHDGENAIGSILGDGWYCGNVEWRGRQLYGEQPRQLLQLEITYTDGTTARISSDDTWHYAFGEILQGDIVMGEHVDHRRSLLNWNTPTYAGADFSPVEIFSAPDVPLVAQASPPVRVTESISPIKEPTVVPSWPSGQFVFDFGQNLVGKIRIRLTGPAGCTVRVRYAEWQNTDGTVYTANLRSAQQTDYFTLSGDPEGEVFETKFTFHGFRYAEVTHGPIRWTNAPTVEDITALVMHSDYELVGDFECSDPLVTQLQKNISWGWRGNSVDVPTDCPQRDERLGWTGDAQVFVRTAMFLADAATFFEKYQDDLLDSQSPEGSIPPTAPNTNAVGNDGGPAWSDAVVICPWTVYLTTGDRHILERHYDSMKAYVAYLDKCSKDYIRSYDGYTGFSGFGDWLSINADTPIDLIGTAFYAHSANLLSQIASVLGHDEDAKTYQSLFETVRTAFRNRYITPNGIVASQTQTAYLLALEFDLMPTELAETAVHELVSNIRRRGTKLSTGFVGSPYLNHVLTRYGRNDVAFDLLAQKQWPSWLYAVTQGATTIWERWDGWTHDKGFQDVGMNSFNHYAYGAIGAWLYQSVAGIDLDPANPAYKRVIMRPNVGNLTHARAFYDGVYGQISSAWRIEEGLFEWDITIPPNTSALVTLPSDVEVAVPEEAVSEGATNAISAGSYHFTCRILPS